VTVGQSPAHADIQADVSLGKENSANDSLRHSLVSSIMSSVGDIKCIVIIIIYLKMFAYGFISSVCNLLNKPCLIELFYNILQRKE
jgi:hypothetical protein